MEFGNLPYRIIHMCVDMDKYRFNKIDIYFFYIRFHLIPLVWLILARAG